MYEQLISHFPHIWTCASDYANDIDDSNIFKGPSNTDDTQKLRRGDFTVQSETDSLPTSASSHDRANSDDLARLLVRVVLCPFLFHEQRGPRRTNVSICSHGIVRAGICALVEIAMIQDLQCMQRG